VALADSALFTNNVDGSKFKRIMQNRFGGGDEENPDDLAAVLS
jgi:hypothetical protein